MMQTGYFSCKKMSKEHRNIVLVKALVVNKLGKVLFVRRERPWDSMTHNKWELPGGKLEFTESIEGCAVRETKEETGYTVKPKYALPRAETFVAEYPNRVSHLLLICYVCELMGGSKSLEDHGVNKVEWFDFSKAMKLDTQPKTVEFLKEHKARGRNVRL